MVRSAEYIRESLNLTGMVIRDDGGDFHQVPEDAELVIEPGQFMLFGLSDDTQVNGGIEVDYVPREWSSIVQQMNWWSSLGPPKSIDLHDAGFEIRRSLTES